MSRNSVSTGANLLLLGTNNSITFSGSYLMILDKTIHRIFFVLDLPECEMIISAAQLQVEFGEENTLEDKARHYKGKIRFSPLLTCSFLNS